MNRPLFLVVAMSLALLPGVTGATPPGAEKRPNVLLIITDQQSAGMMSCAGNAYLKTPAIDSLAQSGARFERAYCSNPVCVPSRVTMMAGVLPSRIGMEANNDMLRVKVPESILQNSLGQVFRRAGYATAFGGKVHVPMTLEQIGFELLTKDDRVQLADDCAAFLRRKHEKPFLLVASFINPHDICYLAIKSYDEAIGKNSRDPGTPKKHSAAKKATPAGQAAPIAALQEALKLPAGVSREEFFRSICPPLPANFEVPQGEPDLARLIDPREFRFYVRDHWSEEQWRLHRWAYCRLTERVDAEIATVLQALRAAGLEDNTLVVFTSDHGDMDAAHRLEHKSVLYEEATRVPFIVRLKGRTKPGLVDRDHLVSTGLDLIPTLCDFAGIAKPPALAGHSVRELVAGQRLQGWRESLVVESNRSRMIRTAQFKYTVYDSGTPREVLIDLEKDPGEMKNLAGDSARADTLQQHRKLLRQWYRDNGEHLDAKYVVQ